MKIRLREILVTVSVLSLAVTSGGAVFNINSQETRITLSGTALGFPIQQQAPGSLSTHFGGRIYADTTATTITFPGGSLIVAENSGEWEPKADGEPGSEPANFGGEASAGFLGAVVAAVRNAQFDVTSSAAPLNNGSFDSASLLFQFIESSAGSLDYNVSGLLSRKGSLDLAGLATNRVTSLGTLSGSPQARTLTIPIAADFYFELLSPNDVQLTITGQLTASELPESGVLFDNGNIFAVQNGPSAPTVFTLAGPAVITYIHNYHYFNNGVLPGTIALRHEDGTIYGPWQTTGLPGQGNVPNAYWKAEPFATLKAGRYTVIDSDPGTWSHNAASGFAGFTYIKGYPVAEEPLPELTIAFLAGEVVISWPSTATSFTLHRASALAPAPNWSPVPAPPAPEDGRFSVRLSAGARSEFYRLMR